jgi:hypothetical protein
MVMGVWVPPLAPDVPLIVLPDKVKPGGKVPETREYVTVPPSGSVAERVVVDELSVKKSNVAPAAGELHTGGLFTTSVLVLSTERPAPFVTTNVYESTASDPKVTVMSPEFVNTRFVVEYKVPLVSRS